MSRWIVCFMLSISGVLYAQDEPFTLSSPLPGKTVLSGSFAEPRSSHFHAGIDFKPQLGIGRDTVRSMADGYISRIVVSPEGYGNAIYVRHPNGLTTVYAHLDRFMPRIEEYIERLMYDKKVYRINHFPEEGSLLVVKEQSIGIMGNTGRSSGAHLHFEVRKTNGQLPVNPFRFGIMPDDTRPPVIRGVVIYSLAPDDRVLHKQYFPVVRKDDQTWTVDGGTISSGSMMIGVAVHAYDTMNGASNHNGIFGINSRVDGSNNFSFELDELDFSTTKYLHAHMDYAYKQQRKYVTKCFVEQNNPLSFYKTTSDKGRIHLYEHLPRTVEIEVYDYHGNTTMLQFEVVRSDSFSHLTTASDSGLFIKPSDTSYISSERFSVVIPPKTFVTPVKLNISGRDNQVIDLKQNNPIPIFGAIHLTAGFDERDDSWIFASLNDKGEPLNHGGEWIDSLTLSTQVTKLDSFFTISDTVPPVIRIQSLPDSTNNLLRIFLRDQFDPSSSRQQVKFEVLLNDQWLLCQQDLKTHTIYTRIKFPRTGSTQRLAVRAVDFSGNVREVHRRFVY